MKHQPKFELDDYVHSSEKTDKNGEIMGKINLLKLMWRIKCINFN